MKLVEMQRSKDGESLSCSKQFARPSFFFAPVASLGAAGLNPLIWACLLQELLFVQMKTCASGHSPSGIADLSCTPAPCCLSAYGKRRLPSQCRSGRMPYASPLLTEVASMGLQHCDAAPLPKSPNSQ